MGDEVTGGPADDNNLSKPQLCQLRLWPYINVNIFKRTL